jgi:5-methylcytosine-specific restriction endonuclease McrA
MNYAGLTDSEIHQGLLRKAADERTLTAEVLKLLKEAERRRLFADLGYGSLYEYCLKELRYSEGSAYRRINAMRLLRDVPDMEEKIQSGTVTLASAASLQTFFREEAKNQRSYSPEEKAKVITAVDGLSKRETEGLLAVLSPAAMVPAEKERAITRHEIEIRFVADSELVAKLDKLKNLLSHRYSERSYADLIGELANIALKKLDPEARTSKVKSRSELTQAESVTQGFVAATKPCVKTRYIPMPLRREVWKRDGARCSFANQETGTRCNSRWQLEIDHIEPHALGGESTLENLRLLCRVHNQHRAQKTFGERSYEGWAVDNP